MTSRAYINGFPIFIFIIWQLPKPKIFSRSREIQLPQRQLLCWAQLDTTLAQQLLCLHWHHMASHGRRRRQYLHTEINSVPIVRLSSRVSALFIRASDCLWLIPICWPVYNSTYILRWTEMLAFQTNRASMFCHQLPARRTDLLREISSLGWKF